MKKSLKKTQEEVNDWIEKFEEGYWSSLSIIARLIEELGEISRILNALHGEKKPKRKIVEEELPEELGDLQFTLICLANKFDIDLQEALEMVMEKYSERDSSRWTPKEETDG